MGCLQSVLNEVNGVSSKEPWKDWSAHPIHQKYKCGHKLGAGAFSQVHDAKNIRTGVAAAVKIVFKERPGLQKKYIQVLRNEVMVLRALNHRNVISLKGVLEDDHQMAIILEKVNGPEMQKHLNKVGHYNEQRAADIFYQCVLAVQHMHDLGYLHRDLKPENILFVENPGSNPNEKISIKLIDMGMSVKLSGKDFTGAMGTPGYLAPECRDMAPHSFAMDIWSLGVILFQMLRGKMPFTKTQIKKFLYTTSEVTQTDAFRARTGNQKAFSPELEKLLTDMLQLRPEKRPTCQQILDSKWVKQNCKMATSRFSQRYSQNDREASALSWQTPSNKGHSKGDDTAREMPATSPGPSKPPTPHEVW